MLYRRSFLTGLAAVVCAPAIVRAEILMPIKTVEIVRPPPLILPYFTAEDWYTAIRDWNALMQQRLVNGDYNALDISRRLSSH